MVRYSLFPSSEEAHEPHPIALRSPLTLGEFAGKWCSFSALPQLPPDQRQEDGGALVFDSEPLTEPVEILGAPEVEVELSSDQPVAILAARLSDVRHDRATTRVTYGVLNLTHRDGHQDPQPLTPYARYRVKLKMNYVAHRFPAGHRIRVALSTSYWPLVWVPPVMATLTIVCGRSQLYLPIRERRVDDAKRPVQFGEALGARPPRVEQLTEPQRSWRVIRDLAEDRSIHEVVRDEGRKHLVRNGLTVGRTVVERYHVHGDDVESARGETEWTCVLERPGQSHEPDWKVRVVTRIVLRSDARNFYIDADVDAYEASRRIFARSYHEMLRRDLV